MKALFLIQGFEVAASRYRVLQVLPFFERAGWQVEVRAFPDDRAGWRALMAQLPRFDLVFNQRKRYGPCRMRALRRQARALVYDFDDAVMVRNATHGRQESWSRRRLFARMARAADLVLAGNEFLAQESRRYTEKVAVIPTPIDTARYQPRDDTHNDRVRLGWIGAHGSLHYLARLVGVLSRLGRRFPALELAIVCDHFLEVPDLRVVTIPWSAEREVEELRRFDVGLMPLGEDPWSRGKCALKILQYGAAAVPAVCTPVGMNADVVLHGVTGLHCTTPGEWEDGLARLIEDAALRRTMGRALRRRVEERYDLAVIGARVETLCRELVGSTRERMGASGITQNRGL